MTYPEIDKNRVSQVFQAANRVLNLAKRGDYLDDHREAVVRHELELAMRNAGVRDAW